MRNLIKKAVAIFMLVLVIGTLAACSRGVGAVSGKYIFSKFESKMENYDISNKCKDSYIELREDGTYTASIYAQGTESGTYTVSGNKLIFESNSMFPVFIGDTVTIKGDTITLAESTGVNKYTFKK